MFAFGKGALCALLAAAVLLWGVDVARAEAPSAGAAPSAAAPSAPEGTKAEPAGPAKAKKKGSKRKKSKKRAGKKAGKKAKRGGGKKTGRTPSKPAPAEQPPAEQPPREPPPGIKRDGGPTAAPAAPPVAEAKTYKVRKGDNLWKIARKTGVDAETIAALNDVEPSGLKPGRTLLLSAPPAPPAVEPPPPAPAEAPVTATAVAENGDAAPTIRERLVDSARKLCDIPYRFGGSTLLGLDCSGYVQKVFGYLGIPLPRTAREMFGLGSEVSREELSLGDLVFFRTYASFPSHVGIYIGNNMFIHASSRDRKVKVDSMDTPYYLRKFIGGKRLPLETGPTRN